MKKTLATIGLSLTLAGGGVVVNDSLDKVSVSDISEKFSVSTEVKNKYVLNETELVKRDIKNSELDKYKGEPKDEIQVTIGDNTPVEKGLLGFFGATTKEFKPESIIPTASPIEAFELPSHIFEDESDVPF